METSTAPKIIIGTPSRIALTKAYQVILDYLRSNTKDKQLIANFEGSEERCVKALLETCRSDSDIAEDLTHILGRIFPVHRAEQQVGGMITQGPITINSHCPHHLYPVRYVAYVSYLPQDGRVLGLSKLTRICKLLGARPVLHEQLANDIADVLFSAPSLGSIHTFPSLQSDGSAAMLVGTHMCMSCRGVQEDAKTAVIELRGSFWKEGMEDKFYQAVHAIKTGNTF